MFSRRSSRACLGLFALLAAPAFSQTLPRGGTAPTAVQSVALSTTLGFSDNIRGENNDQESETIAGVGLQLRLGKEHRRLNYSLHTDLQYLDYLGNTFDAELMGQANFDADLVIVPEMLTFVVQDNFGQQQNSPFAPSTPETRQNVNVFGAGPDLRVELGDVLVMLGSGRYMLENYETTAADNERTQAQLGFYHEFSADSSLGVMAQNTNVTYDEDTTGVDFERNEYLLRYRLSARRTAMLVEGGQSKFSADDGIERDIWLYRANLSRLITTRTYVVFAAGRELSDSGSLFVSTSADPVQPGTGNSGQSDAFTEMGLGGMPLSGSGIVASTDSLELRYARASWRLAAPRTRAYVSGEMREERYFTGTSQNRDVQVFSGGIERNLSAALRLGIDVSHSIRQSDISDVDLQDTMYRLSAFWQATRRLELSLAGEHSVRSGSTAGGGFDDNRIWARLIWTPRGAVQ